MRLCVVQMWQQFDTDGVKFEWRLELSTDQFLRIFQHMGCLLTPFEEEIITDLFNIEDTGFVSHDEFMNWCIGGSVPKRAPKAATTRKRRVRVGPGLR